MIRSSLKTFFKNLIFVFVPIGIIYFFFVLIFFGLVQAVFSEAVNALGRLAELLQTSVGDAETTVYDYFSYAFAQIDWNANFFDVIRTVLDSGWLYNTLVGFLDTLNVTVEGFGDQAYGIVGDFAAAVAANFAVSLIAFVFVLLLANFVTRWVLRRENAKRGIGKKIIAWLVQSTVVAAVLGVAVFLTALWAPGAAVMAAVYIVVISFTAMLSAWLIHGRGKVKFRAAVNGRNMTGYFLSSVLIIAVCAAVLALIWLLFGILAAVLAALPVLIYAGNIIGVNADAYVLSLALAAAGKTSESADSAPETTDSAPEN